MNSLVNFGLTEETLRKAENYPGIKRRLIEMDQIVRGRTFDLDNERDLDILEPLIQELYQITRVLIVKNADPRLIRQPKRKNRRLY